MQGYVIAFLLLIIGLLFVVVGMRRRGKLFLAEFKK
jgi:hypothetical protein